jgi:hypothetical protein
MYIVQKLIYTIYTVYIYNLYSHISTSGIVIYYEGYGYHTLTPRKYNGLNGKFVFDLRYFHLHDPFQDCNPGLKQDQPAHTTSELYTM